jgi:hypothetical protein
MAASVDAAAAAVAVAPPPAVEESGGAVEQARTLIGALNLLSRNLPLPPDVLRAVSSIYHDGGAGDEEEEEEGEEQREAEKEGDKEMAAAADGVAEAKEDPADGATTKVRATVRVVLLVRVGDSPSSVRVLTDCVLDWCHAVGALLVTDCGIRRDLACILHYYF